MSRKAACRLMKVLATDRRKLTMEQISNETGMSRNNAGEWLAEMQAQGLVKIVGRAPAEKVGPQPLLWQWAPELPADIREALQASYQPSQEVTGLPSPTFADAADLAQAWIRRETTKQHA